MDSEPADNRRTRGKRRRATASPGALERGAGQGSGPSSAEAESAAAANARLLAIQTITDAALAHLDLDDLIRELLGRIRTLLKSDTATILLLGESQQLTAWASRGLEEEVEQHVKIPVGRGIAGRVVSSREPVLIEDLSKAEVASPILRERVRSVIAVPLLIEGRAIGAIEVGTIRPRRFTQDDLYLLRLVADRAALAVENARLFQQASSLAAIVESSADAIIGKTLEGIITSWNRGAERLYGYTAAEIVGRPISTLSPSDRPDPLAGFAATIRRGERIYQIETVQVRKDGQRVDVSVSISPVRNSAGEIVGAATISRDITERKRGEAERERLSREIDAQRRLLETVVENAPAAIAVLRGPDFVLDLVNPAYQAFAPGKPMQGRPFAEVWPELAELVLPILKRAMATGEVQRTLDGLRPIRRTPEGALEEAYFTFTNVPLRPPSEEGGTLLIVGAEITQQVLARQQIERLADIASRRAAELQGILDNMVDGVYVADTEGRIVLTNEAGVHLLGLPNAQAVRRPIGELLATLQIHHPDGRAVAYDEMLLVRSLAGQTIVQEAMTFRNPRTGLDVYIRGSSAPVRNGHGETVGAVAVTRDVTELSELDRLKDEFISVAAHELKTPVTIMKGYAESLLRTTDGAGSPQHRVLEAINRGADRIDSIVNDLLDVSRLHLGQLPFTTGRVDLCELVCEVVDRLALTTKHRLRVVCAKPLVTQGDRERLKQVLNTLIDNAVRYSPEGGDVDVALTDQEGKAVISVQDHGVGIPKGRQAHIFERFYRAHTGTPYDYGGMGVGLYISREIVNRHGGRMWFESEEGKGSTFHFSLPLGPAHPSDSEAAEAAEQAK